MLAYPNDPFPIDLVGVLASYFKDGRGPSHSDIASAVASAGIDDRDTYANKPARVRGAFSHATGERSFRLAEELLSLLRNDDAFGRMPSQVAWAKRARVAFERVHWYLDANGYVDWGLTPNDPEGLLPYVQPQGALAAANVAIARDARAAKAQAHSPKSAVLDQLNGDLGATVPGAYSAGDAIGRPRTAPAKITSDMAPKIFLVHGHDEAARLAVESFVARTTGIMPTVLMLEASGGRTVIEKFEAHADESSYAIVLMTADDLGQSQVDADSEIPANARARQNVVFEFGYFVGYLKRSHVAALVVPGVERPSDIAGVVYIEFVARSSDWKEALRREMREAGVPIIG